MGLVAVTDIKKERPEGRSFWRGIGTQRPFPNRNPSPRDRRSVTWSCSALKACFEGRSQSSHRCSGQRHHHHHHLMRKPVPGWPLRRQPLSQLCQPRSGCVACARRSFERRQALPGPSRNAECPSVHSRQARDRRFPATVPPACAAVAIRQSSPSVVTIFIGPPSLPPRRPCTHRAKSALPLPHKTSKAAAGNASISFCKRPKQPTPQRYALRGEKSGPVTTTGPDALFVNVVETLRVSNLMVWVVFPSR